MVRMESPAVGQPQSGLVLATVELDTILRLTAGGMLFSPGGEMAHIELRELREDGSSVRMAGTAPAGAEASRGASWAHHVQPIFILGRTYALILRPGPGFAAEYPLRAGWSAIVHGMLLTAAAAWLAVVLGAQRRRLEEAVESRTADLRASLERFGQLSEHSRALIWEVDPDGLFTYVSDNVLDILGYSPAELVGRRRFHDLFPETDREEVHGPRGRDLRSARRLPWLRDSGSGQGRAPTLVSDRWRADVQRIRGLRRLSRRRPRHHR